MPTLVSVTALLAGVAGALLTGVPLRPTAAGRARERATNAPEVAPLRRARPVLMVLIAIGGWTVIGGVVGIAAGVVGAAIAHRALGRVESPAERRRREELERQLPFAISLLGSSLQAGADVVSALAAVAQAMPGAVADTFGEVAHAMKLGAASDKAWMQVHHDVPALRRLAGTVIRSQETGAAVSLAVRRLGDDLASERRARAEALARRVGVQAALPLGVCFLPAFMLIGIVPMAAGLFRAMHLF